MSDFKFFCPHCDQHLVVGKVGAGATIPCPTYNQQIVVPVEPAVVLPPLLPIKIPSNSLPPFASFPCPQCRRTNVRKVGFTLWGGFLGPIMFNHIECQGCGTTYNGKTGKSNAAAIAVYVAVSIVVVLILYAISPTNS